MYDDVLVSFDVFAFLKSTINHCKEFQVRGRVYMQVYFLQDQVTTFNVKVIFVKVFVLINVAAVAN